MKKLLYLLLFLVILGGGVFFYATHQKGINFSQLYSVKIASPLPQILTKVFPKAEAGNEYWRPNTKGLSFTNLKKPDLSATSAISYDLTTDTLLFEKYPKKRLPIASLTKIMTSVIALENNKLDQGLNVTHDAANIGEDSMGLTEGEKLKFEDLLYGLILNSGNDAAETIAQDSPFGRANFIYLMNKKAEDFGLTDTHFTNPTGLEGDGNQYSTAYDLLVISRYALEIPEFATVAATYEHDIPQDSNHKEYTLYNETNLLTSYPGVKGIKTGYTYEAGLCLITYLDYDGHRIIAILLNAENRRQEMKDLLDYSLKTLGVKPPPHD